MSRLYIFADEAGCMTFERKPNVSKYFVLCTVAMGNCDVAGALVDLRRKLAWDGAPLGEYFHATSDKQCVRDAVFETIMKYDFHVHATVMEKSKAQPQLRNTQTRFYQHGWFYHFKFGIAPKIKDGVTTLVTAASIGQKKHKASFQSAVDDVMHQTMKPNMWKTDFPPAAADPCVQVADYCAWAIQRKLETKDDRSYKIIQPRIKYYYDLFFKGTEHYY